MIRLEGYNFSAEPVEGGRIIVLTYSGVRNLSTTADPEQGLQGSHGYGDLGYDEVELLPDGAVEHRLLFSSGIELTVQFDHFRLAYRDIAIDPAWRTPDVLALAHAIDDDLAFDRMPELAAALEEAGCDDADLLGHLGAETAAGPPMTPYWSLGLILKGG